MTIKGIKSAVGSYNRLNAGGIGRPLEGRIMLDCEDGRVWTDEYPRGTNGSYVYPESVMDLSYYMRVRGFSGRHETDMLLPERTISMATVRTMAERLVAEWTAEHEEA